MTYTLILLTVLWSDYDRNAVGTTTTRITVYPTQAACEEKARLTNRTLAVTSTKNVTLIATCVAGG